MAKVDVTGRTFKPIIEAVRKSGEGPVDGVSIAPNGAVCIAFTAPARKGARVDVSVTVVPNAQWTSSHPHGVRSIASISETKGDFSKNATAGLQNRVGAMVGGGRGYIAITAGQKYWANVCYLDATNPKQPDLRVQLTFSA